MRERGVEAVTIQDITEAADVGHGTFYLHFDTKAEVLRPVIELLTNRIHDEVDRVTRGAEDPALRFAAGIRIALRAMGSDPLWNWFVFQSGTPFRRFAEEMGSPPVRDMRNGIASGRFRVADLATTVSFVDGALLGVLNAWSQGTLADDAAEATAELILQILGLPPEDAARIARESLDLALPPTRRWSEEESVSSHAISPPEARPAETQTRENPTQ